jgi:protein-S-isoprenylcysteine O-methyltransferase Ste14
MGRRVSLAALADALVIAAWVALVLDNAWRARREREPREEYGPVIAGGWRPPGALRLALLAGTLAGALFLEREAGRLPFRPGLAMLGLGLVSAAVVLHARARRALGPLWSNTVAVRARHHVVEDGPYAVVRHPLYLALLLLAAGTVLVHTSLATACLLAGIGAGIVLKIPIEERALRAALPGYASYAARVPVLLPRLRRRRS